MANPNPTISPNEKIIQRNRLRDELMEFFASNKNFLIGDVTKFLESDDEYTLDISIRKIGALGIKSNFQIIANFSNHPSSSVRAAVANAFGLIRDRRAINILKKMHADVFYLVRWESILALSNIGTKDANPVFLKGLKDAHPVIRMISARALGENREIEVMPYLTKAAGDINKPVRAAVIEALGKSGYQSALGIIEEAVIDSDPEVRTTAIIALGNFPHRRYLHYLRNSINDYSDSVKMASIKTLEVLGYEECIPLIQKLTHDKNPSLRQAVAKALGVIAGFGQIHVLTGLIKDSNPKVRAEAATALGKLGYYETTAELIRGIKDRNEKVRAAAASALCLINEQHEIDQNIASSHFTIQLQNLESGDLVIREEAARNLAYKGVKFAVKALTESAKDAYIEIRRLSIKALAYINDKRGVPVILNGLSDPCLRVRWESVYHLENYIGRIKITPIIRLLLDDESSIRMKCAQLLGYNKSTEAINALIKAIGDTEISVRREIVSSICKYDVPQIVAPLKSILVDPVSEIGCLAAIKLAEMKIEDGAGILITAMRHPDIQIRRDAIKSANMIKSSVCVRSALKLIEENDELLKLYSMMYIAKHADASILKNIKRLVAKESTDLKCMGLESLAKINNLEAYEFAKTYTKSTVSKIRLCALMSILKMNIPEVEKEKIVLNILKNSDEPTKKKIIENINLVLPVSGKKFLFQLSKDNSSHIAPLAVSMLTHYPDDDTHTLLMALLKSPRSGIPAAAEMALKQLGVGWWTLLKLRYFS